MQSIDIIAGESIYYEIDFTQALPPGATSIASATASVKKISANGSIGAAYDELLSSTTCTVVSGKPRFKIVGAVASERYRVEIATTTNDAQIFKSRLFFNCASA